VNGLGWLSHNRLLNLHVWVTVVLILVVSSSSTVLGWVVVLVAWVLLLLTRVLTLEVGVLTLVVELLSGVLTLIVLTWLLHGHHKGLNNVGDLVKVLVTKATVLFLLVTSEVLLVSSVFVLKITVLLDLVMVNIKSSTIESQVLGVLNSLSSVRSLVADESIWALAFASFENSD